jgi:ABC-type multidrug transport system ATPase subunit
VADEGAAVLWATQRLDEIRGFAARVTVLDRGRVRFAGTVASLMEHARDRRYLLRVRHGTPVQLQAALAATAHVEPAADGGEHYLLVLAEGATLGAAIAALEGAGVAVLTCRHEESDVEQAFLAVVGGTAA